MKDIDNKGISKRLDVVLDKISKYGISSLTTVERNFIDSFSSENGEQINKSFQILNSEEVYEDDLFKFEYISTREFIDRIQISGIIYVPDFVNRDGRKIKGRIKGTIDYHEGGQVSLMFEKGKIDIFDFCGGIEYELDSFIDYVISQVIEKNRSKN